MDLVIPTRKFLMTNRNSGSIDPAVAWIALGVGVFASIVFIGGPQYNVWQQSLAGKAELQKAEYTRQVAVLEAQAKKDSAQQLAEAEIIRAGGVAKANQIIGDSLKDNREYLQYLYITGIEEGSQKGNVTIYVPTEGGMPVPTLQMNK
jgi:regulator of protease activity HflC (stomatin/prohibitin superfamily)